MGSERKILIVCEYGSLNGGERSLLAVLPHLRDRGIAATVACPQRGDLASAVAEMRIPVLPFHVSDGRGSRRALRAIQDDVANLIHEVSPHGVHANSLSMSRLLGSVALGHAIPSLGHLRDMMRISRAAVDHLNRHHRLLAVSEAVKQWYIGQAVDVEKLRVLYNGVDLREFAPRASTGALRRQLMLPPSTLMLGAIGQLGMRKGLDLLLPALVPTIYQYDNVHLVIAGQRYSQKSEAVEFENQLRRLARSHPLCGHVHFLGVCDDVARLMNELDILVHAARQEPLGRVLLEAAASGLPTVATRVGGTSEIFPPGTETALLVPPDAPAALADAIVTLMRDTNLRQRMGRAARKRAEQFFDASTAAEQLARHYHTVTS